MANEKRLIDANKLKWKLGQVTLYVQGLRFGKTVLSKILESYRQAVFTEIDDAPTVDAVEVVHGRWEKVKQDLGDGIKTYRFGCSECGYLKNTLTGNYCPNCGADMRGENG